MANCPSRFSLVQLVAKDLPQGEMQSLRSHLANCQSCHEIAREIESHVAHYEAKSLRQNQAITSKITNIDAQIDPSSTPLKYSKKQRTRLALKWIAPLAAAVAVTLALVPALFQTKNQPTTVHESNVRFKGPIMTFDVVAKRFDHQFKVEPEAILLADDALRFIVTTSSSGYLTVFSLDDHGGISPFYPDTEPAEDPAPMRLSQAGHHELPGSIILDDSVGKEHFVVVFSTEWFDRRELHARIKREGRPQNEPQMYMKTLRIEKRSR